MPPKKIARRAPRPSDSWDEKDDIRWVTALKNAVEGKNEKIHFARLVRDYTRCSRQSKGTVKCHTEIATKRYLEDETVFLGDRVRIAYLASLLVPDGLFKEMESKGAVVLQNGRICEFSSRDPLFQSYRDNGDEEEAWSELSFDEIDLTDSEEKQKKKRVYRRKKKDAVVKSAMKVPVQVSELSADSDVDPEPLENDTNASQNETEPKKPLSPDSPKMSSPKKTEILATAEKKIQKRGHLEEDSDKTRSEKKDFVVKSARKVPLQESESSEDSDVEPEPLDSDASQNGAQLSKQKREDLLSPDSPKTSSPTKTAIPVVLEKEVQKRGHLEDGSNSKSQETNEVAQIRLVEFLPNVITFLEKLESSDRSIHDVIKNMKSFTESEILETRILEPIEIYRLAEYIFMQAKVGCVPKEGNEEAMSLTVYLQKFKLFIANLREFSHKIDYLTRAIDDVLSNGLYKNRMFYTTDQLQIASSKIPLFFIHVGRKFNVDFCGIGR